MAPLVMAHDPAFFLPKCAVIRCSSFAAISIVCLLRRTTRCPDVSDHAIALFSWCAPMTTERLDNLRGRVFGCNSLSSNSGMNLPRLALARIAGARAFFSSVVVTGAHVTSLQYLADRTIDVCSIDSVTWGLFEKFSPVAAEQYRILDETVSSPCPPFVTSIDRTASEAAALARRCTDHA